MQCKNGRQFGLIVRVHKTLPIDGLISGGFGGVAQQRRHVSRHIQAVFRQMQIPLSAVAAGQRKIDTLLVVAQGLL